MISLHTSPLDQPGTGDAGGMNVYVVELSKRLADLGIEVDVFTRATSSALPPKVEVLPGVAVRNVAAGPFEGPHELFERVGGGELLARVLGYEHVGRMRLPVPDRHGKTVLFDIQREIAAHNGQADYAEMRSWFFAGHRLSFLLHLAL